MWLDRRAVVLVDLDAAAGVGLEPGVLEPQIGGRALAAGRVHDGVGGDPLAAGQGGQRGAVVLLDRRHRLAQPEHQAEVAQVVLQRLDHLVVAELEQPLVPLDDGHAGAERGEDRGVLDADHPGADHDERRGDLGHVEDAVGVEDGGLVELDVRRAGRDRAGRDHDLVGLDRAHAPVRVGHLDPVLVDEPALPGQHPDVVSGELVSDHVHLARHHLLGAPDQILDGDLFLDPVALAVQAPLGQAGEVDRRLAQRLGGDRAGVRAHAADGVAALDHGDRGAHLGRLDRRLLPGRARAQHHEIEAAAFHRRDATRPAASRWSSASARPRRGRPRAAPARRTAARPAAARPAGRPPRSPAGIEIAGQHMVVTREHDRIHSR